MRRGHTPTGGKEEQPNDLDVAAAGGPAPTASSSRDAVETVNEGSTDILQAAGAVETGNWQYKQANAAAELRNPQLVGRASSTPLEGTADSKMSQAAEAPGIQESERATGSFRISDRASIQDEKQKCAVEAAVSAVIAAAADGAAEQEQEAPPKTNQEGGRASSVLSSLLSAALRQLLPWVLPCALQGASAADVKVNIAKKQLTLSGISLQPQELTAVTGAPLHLLHCSIGELQLQVGRQEEAGAVEAARNTTVTASNLGSKISEGCASSPVATAAAADGVANFVSREESSSLRISVKDVIVVLAPTSSQEWSRQQLLELALQRRRSLLYNMDSELKQQEVQKQSGFSPCLSSLISHWIDRHIQWASLDLHNLHLRLEFLVPPCNNSSSTGSTAFAFGVHLEEFRMRTLPSEESKDLSACTAHGQQQRSQETVATSPHRVTEAAGESLPNSGTSRNYGFNSQGSVCSEFDIKGCSMYTQNELLLLAPHTRTVVENVERLCAVRAEQQQQDGHPKSQQAEEDQLPPGQNCQMRLDCRLPVSARSLLSPLGIHGFLRKNAVIECPKGNGGRGSSSEALRQGGSRSESDSAVLYVNETTPAAGPAYVASVESDCLEVTFSPGVLRGLRWLTANLEMHSKGVDAAEAILSLVRPFVPSCTVKGNPRIWWRFAIRAICRLQRSGCSSVYTNSSNFAIGAQLGITGDGLAAEESLKLRLCTEKAVTYRRLRLLQLQAMLTERQLDQLLRLRDSIPLPQLLQSHAAARQDFMDQRSKAPGAETTKMWGRWFSIWRKSPLKQGCTTGVNTATGECNAPDDAELRNSYFPRPPLPPLPLHSLLDQHRMERQTHEKSGQQTLQKGMQQQQGQHEQQQTCPEEEACLSGFDDFFDARSQPATARLSGNLRLHVGPGEDSTPGLMLAASKETQQHMQAYEGTTEAEEPFPPYLENRALGGVCTGEGASQEGNGSSAMEFAPAAVAPGATKSNSESTVRREDDLSDSEDTFYDCLDFQPPGPTSLESCAGVALGATSTTSRTSLDRIQSPVNLPATSKQIAYTMEVSVLVRSASIACRLDKLKSSQAESAPERRCSFLKQKQGSQKAVGSVVLCSIGAVRVNGTIGNERFEGGASIDRLDISFNGGGLQDKEKLVFMDRETGNEPLISFHISQNMVSPPSAPIVDDSSGCSQEAEPSSGIRNVGGSGGSEQSSTFLSLKLRRVICILDPHALKETAIMKREFSSAAAGAELVATEASQQCSLLHLSGCTRPGNKCCANLHTDRTGVGPTAYMDLHRRLLRLSAKRQQQLRDGASLRYIVSVEAPTVILPASEGQAILCHLGELRVCSAHLEEALLLCTHRAEVEKSQGFRFADTAFQNEYTRIFRARGSPAAPPAAAGAARTAAHARQLQRVSLRTHHGLLLRDYRVLLHTDLEQLKRKLASPQSSGSRDPMGSSDFRICTCQNGHWEDRRHLKPMFHPQEQTTGSTTCSKEMQYGENAGSNLRDTEPLPTAWGVCNVVQPVLLPSELAAAVEVEHIDMLAPRLVFPPSKLRQQTRHSPREFRTASFKFHHSQPSAGKGAKLGAGQQEVSHSLPQPKQYQHQEQEELNAHDPQEQRPCEVQIYVNGKCKGIMASLSRRSCAALLSSFESLKTALSGNGVTAVSPGCSSFGSAVKVSSTCAEGSSGWNDGCNSRKAREVDEVSNSIPVYIDASLEWEKLGIDLHSLEDSTDVQRRVDGQNDSLGRVVGGKIDEEDALQLQATDVSAHFSNRGCGTACRLEMKQLLLEQPSLPAESINRYIVCVPPLNRSSATEGAAADFSGGPGVQLAFTSGTCTTSAPGAAPTTVSVHVLRPMTLNFRPTALTWVVNFLKAPFGSCVRTRNAGSDGENNSTYYETRMQHNKNNGCAQQFEVEVEAALKSSEGLGSSPEDGAPKPPHVGEVAAELADSWPQGDPVLRGIRVQFQRVNILWCTRGSDKPLATASLSAASVGLDLGRHSTKITGSIRDLTLHFVVPSLISAETAVHSSAGGREDLGQVQRRQTPLDASLEHCAGRAFMPNQFPRTVILQTTEIIGLVPGKSYALSLSLNSVHPLSPQFSGISSDLKVDVGECRVVYIHPKFWRLFSWIIDDFVGTLTSQPSVVLPPQDTRVGNISGSQEAPPKLIERSPSLEDIAARAVLQSDAAGEMPASARALHSGVRECTDEGLTSGFDKKLPLIVPNEGLRRIFLLADAGRSVLGLPPLFKESQEGAGVSGGGDTKLHRLVLPQALPFSAFHYEIQITSPRLLLPATCRPNTGVILWPPAFCDGGDLNRDHVACGARYSTTSPAIDRDVGACKRTNYPAGSESSSVREVVCLLDNFKVSNSWNLSREHGVVESINVTFKGAKGFAKLGFPQDFNNLCSRMAAGPADPRCRADSEASYLGGTCRRCARRVPCCRRSSIGESRISCKSPAAATSGDSEATAAPEYPGRYLFGSVDLVIRMLRPLLLRCSSRWLRVEAGLLPLALDVQTLGLLFDIVENNITANDPDTVIENTEKPPPSCTERRAEGFLASKRDARFSVSSSASQDVSGAATPSFQERLSELAQKLLGNHILQGLLEPQVDFIELLEEWGRETLLLELVIEGLHLAVREQPLKNQVLMLREQCGALRRCIRVLECRQGLRKNQSKISRLSAQEGESQRRSVDRLSEVSIPQQTPFLLFHATRLRAQLRSLRLQPEQAEQVGLVLSTAALAPPWTSFVNFGEEQKTVGKTGNPSLISPVTGTFMGMRVGSTTVFSPELVPPFSVVFTDSTCPVGLLQQQLDPIADVLRQAESDAVAAAISIARIDEKLAAQSGLATNSDQKDEDQLKQSDKQLSGSSAQPQCQEEHLLVAPFAAAWVEPLQLQSQTQDSSGDEHELTSRDPVAGSSADVANSGRFPLPRSGTFTLRSNSAEATSASPFEVPACSRDYEVVFRCCQKTRQQHRMMKPTVPAHLVPHPSDLALTYKSASAVPVIPLSEGCVLTLLKQNYGTPEEKMQVLRRLLGRRHHRRKQKRITVSSSKPRCVLDLPLLSRISTFLSNNEATSVDAYAATDTSGDETTAVLSHRESWQGMRWISNVTAPLSRSGHSRVREIPRKRTRSPGDSERNPNQGPAACLSQSEFTGDHSSKQGSNSDSELSSTSSNVGKATSQKAMSGSATLLAESELTQFGSRAFALCRSSFDSAKRFAAGLSNRCSSGTPVDPYAGGSATDGTSNASDSETTNKNIQNNNVGSKHRISRHSACSPREAVAVATPRRQELPPLQLNTMEIAVHLSEASVLLPVNSKCCETSSVLLHGSVNVCRRADDIRDPIEPHGTSKDAESAAGAYEHIQTCDSKGNRQSFWVCGSSSATSAAEEEKAPKEMLQQEEAFWQGTTKFLDNLPDRFCPGVRGVDISLQKAAVTCLRNSIPLHQLGANAVDVSKLGGNLDLRSSRRMRWSTRGGKCGGSPDRQATQPNPEELGSKCLMPGELRCAEGEVGIEPHMRCVRRAALSGHDTSAANTFPLSAPVKNQANSHPNDKLSGTDAHHDESVQPAASVTEVHNNARSICSGLKAQISHVFIPPAARCRRDESGVAQSVTDAAQGGIGDASCNSCEVQHHQNGGSSHERCCCCLTNVGISTGVGVGEGTFGLVCDCCCHHPQEYTALQVCACELELSYLDCLLICRCASEQTMQLEQQQQCQQAQLAAVQRLLHRRAVLEQHLSMEHRLLQGQSMEDDDQTPASQASFSVSFPCSISPEIHRRTHRRLASPTAAAASPARQGKQFISTYPRQRHFSARMPLLRVTLLNDHLDCLQAPLLQLLVLNCRLSQACSLLPPHAMDSPRLCPQEQPQKPQVSSVSLLSASLRLWAFNPFAVAFEPVVESLPLLLVIREAPYSLMRSSYSSCCDDDSLALSVGQSVCRGRRKRMTPRPPLHSFSHGSGRETLMGTASSSPALTPRQQMSSSNNNHSSISSTEKDSGRSVASLLSRLPEDAASRGVRAFENEQQQAFSSSGLAATAPLRKELSLRGRNSEEVSVSSTQIQGSREQFVHLGVEGGSDAPNPVGYASTTEVASSPRRYLGILLSSTDGSSIEANLSPLLLQSVLGSLCKWHCDFTHHLQQQQRQRPRKACGNSSVCEAGARLSQVSHQAVSRQYEQKMPQHEEKEKCAPNHVKSQLRAGHEEGAPEVPGGRRRSLIADTLLLRRLPSRSLDASPICLSPAQDGYPERRHSLGGSLPEGVADGSLDNQLPQQEQRPFREAAGPKRGKLFIPYHVVNQTGLHLGVRLLPTPAALRALDSEGLYGGNAVHATAAGLPPTLRLCRQHNREVGACEEDGSSSDSSSNASEAEGGRALASVPIHWDFGSTLQTVARGPHGAASATTSASNRGTFSCPSSPPTSREEKSIHLEPRGDSSGWDWLLPSEERALTQMRVSIGTASTAHVTLQLAKRTLGGIATEQPLLKNTVPISALQPENWSTDGPDVHGEGSYRRWRLLMPVPLDRVGVYIQPLTDVEATTPTGSAVTTDIQKQTAPFVVCRLVADAGTKQLLVQSQVVLRSNCSVPLQVLLLPPLEAASLGQQAKDHRRRADSEEAEQLADFHLKPGETSAVPVDFCFTARLRVRPVQAGKTYSWSRDLSLGMLWQVVDGTEQQKPSGSGASGEAGRGAFKQSFPKTDVLRCCPLIGSSVNKSCLARNPVPDHDEAPKEHRGVDSKKMREPDYHIVVLYRYRINCPLVLRPGEDPPGDSEGLIQLNEWQQVHSFPLAGVAFLSISLTEGRWSKRTQVHPRPLQKRTPPPTAPKAAVAGASGVLSTTAGGGQTPADCAAGCSSGAGKQESSTESVTGETIVEVECFDSKYRSAKVWVIFCDSDGGSPCLLLHSPVWLVSHVEWALQKQRPEQPQPHSLDSPAAVQTKGLPTVEYSVIRRSSRAELGWAMQAVSAAAAAVDLNRETDPQKPSQIPNFTCRRGLRKDCTGDIRLLDFSTSSIRVETDGIGCSEFLDMWGDFPRRLSVSDSCTKDLTAGSRSKATPRCCNRSGRTSDNPATPSEEGPSLENAVGGPCLDLVAAMSEAPLPLLRPVLLLTLSPVYTITSQCLFPIRVRQARPACHCNGERSVDTGIVDFTLQIQPHHTEALVWQFKDGSRSLQIQGLMPTLCWLQGGCKCCVSTSRASESPETVWSAWSGYSPLCLPGNEWCIRLPSAPSYSSRTILKTHGTHGNSPARSDAPLQCADCEIEDPEGRQERTRQEELLPIPTVEPQELLGAILRRGVSVQNNGNHPTTKRSLPERLTKPAFSASGCSALRLEAAEGPANTVNLTVQVETFDMRDTVSVCNDTPLPLLLRQCFHSDTQEGKGADSSSCQGRTGAQKLGLTEAAAFGVDSVATAVAELWEAAKQGGGLQQHQLSSDVGDSFGHHDPSNVGGHSRPTHLLSMLLEAQQSAEQQKKTKVPTGATPFHSSEAVYISAVPQEEGTHILLDRLVRVANAAAAQSATEQLQPQKEDKTASSYNARNYCCWCSFESAVSRELCTMHEKAMEGTVSGKGDEAPSNLSFLPQLVLPGETVLFTWDDYRCLPCIELTYFPWLEQQNEGKSLASTKEPLTNSRGSAVSHATEYPFDKPFVVCIPLRPGVQGVVPLPPLPSFCWLLFRVFRHAGRLLLQIAPAGDILGITHLPPHGAVERNQQGTIRQLNNESSHTSVLLKSTNRPTGSAMSPWAEADTDQVTTSRNDVDVNSLLLIPRYFQLPMVDMDLTAGCSRSQELSSACDGRVPPWSFSSMCKFSGTFVGSYAPDRKAESAAPRTTIPAKADAGNHDAAQPVQPTPDPPTFELRIQVPRLQFSVLSQGAVTDPLSRQTFRLPEELLLVTFEGLSAAYFCSPFHSAAACRIQELQIDSMHSQAYYPVLLQRAPPMPSEAGSATDSDVTQVSRITCSTLKDKGGDSSRSGEPLHASVSKSEDDGGALVEFLLQQRLPFYGSRDDRVVVIDNCSLSLKPVSVRTDLKSVYMASEALSCWQSAWAAATTSMSMHSPEKNSGFPASHGHQRGPEGAPRANNGSSVLRGEGVPSEDEDLEYHYAKQSGLVWACKGNKICQSPLSLFVSHIAGTGLVVVPTRLAVRPWLCKPKAPSLEGQQHTFSQRREQRYIFRLLTIASTCVVLSFKADTGGNSSALRRSVVTLSSLEDARFEVDGLHVTGRRLMDQLKELHQQQQPHVHQDCSRLTKLTRHHRHPALALRDVARVVGHFYQQQLLSHLSKLLVSVDLLGNPALSFAHLQAGVYALAKQPMAAAETGGDVFEGMMKGAEDFLKHTGYGVFGGISRMAGVASDSLGALACDEVYVHSRKQQGRHKARNVEEGLQQGVEALGRALAGGFTGLVEEPVRGAAEGGFEGLLRGAGRGIAGFLVKPLTGVLDLAQKTAEAIKDASQVEGHQRPRFRLPRLLLGDFRLLVAYDAEAAKAKAILTDAEGQYWENLPVLFFALDRRLQALTVLTASNILLFKYYSRSHAELRFLAPISCLLAVGHCSTPNSSTSSGTCSGSRIRSTSSKHRHALVLQLRQEGESGVYYQQLLYSSARLQGHISNSLRQLLLQ